MSYQVVNPATGEIAAQFPDTESDKTLAIALCKECCVPGEIWAVIQIMEVFRCDKRSVTSS